MQCSALAGSLGSRCPTATRGMWDLTTPLEDAGTFTGPMLQAAEASSPALETETSARSPSFHQQWTSGARFVPRKFLIGCVPTSLHIFTEVMGGRPFTWSFSGSVTCTQFVCCFCLLFLFWGVAFFFFFFFLHQWACWGCRFNPQVFLLFFLPCTRICNDQRSPVGLSRCSFRRQPHWTVSSSTTGVHNYFAKKKEEMEKREGERERESDYTRQAGNYFPSPSPPQVPTPAPTEA